MDIVDKQTRSRMMAAVKSKNTALEVEIRHRLFQHGYRYRLHKKDLPGKPDITFPKYRTVVFVNGCFWHMHNCSFGHLPKTRTAWWKQKLTNNRRRDLDVLLKLRNMAWRIIVVWECSLRSSKKDKNILLDSIVQRIERHLHTGKKETIISGPIQTGAA